MDAMKCNLSNYSKILLSLFYVKMHYLGKFKIFRKLGFYKPTRIE
jgi:hypothetical protein